MVKVDLHPCKKNKEDAVNKSGFYQTKVANKKQEVKVAFKLKTTLAKKFIIEIPHKSATQRPVIKDF